MFVGVVVIYNKKCASSESIRDFMRYSPESQLIVFDNSDKDYGNREYCKKLNIKYYTLGGNVGLSKAYNYVIDRIDKKSTTYVMMLDDDTVLTQKYFAEVTNKIKLGNDVLVPIVKSNNTIISPIIMKRHQEARPASGNDVLDPDFSAINSGMVVKSTIFNMARYNEDLFLDYVDHDFMRNLRQRGAKFYVLDCVIKQDFSMHKHDDIKQALPRFKIFCKDYTKYYKAEGGKMYRATLLKMALRNCIKYKTLKFLRCL